MHEVDVGSTATDLRSRILREATRLFAERGYNATSVRELVEAAGCTKPALYYYFDNKEALFLEAIRAATESMTKIVEATTNREGSIRERLLVGIDGFFSTLEEYEMPMRLLMRAELQPDENQPSFDLQSVRGIQRGMIEQLLRAGVERGEIRSDVDVGDAGNALTGMVDQRVRLWVVLGEPIPADIGSRILRIFFNGVG